MTDSQSLRRGQKLGPNRPQAFSGTQLEDGVVCIGNIGVFTNYYCYSDRNMQFVIHASNLGSTVKRASPRIPKIAS